ncbi:GntR family transcriptional regulator [Mycolicibacterium pyrenivorans]|uniref:GntR family transcriptional regulator n=1 Tax=Mycolicibacterium pyrenivorans TaxID=187102 RepID=UPI0021F369D2|nr:GntR family transcriptional regulator [Mycolicibacterium pyrenivorans]MCV7149780.1 GntR family transcriptional regulator [Mycolicibacterium pyrenivorans]
MSAGEPYGACRPKLHHTGSIRPDVLYQRQRHSPDRLNNSQRRTYDLLRSTLMSTSRNLLLVERELTDALSASRSTVRAVLQQLAREGLVTREPKNGTRATGSLLLPIDELKTMAQLSSEPSPPVESRTIECRPVGCPPLVRDRLRLPVDWNVLMIESLMMHDGLTIGLTVGYIAVSEDQSCGIDVEGQDVISILERQLGIRIGPSRTTVGAVAADEQTADLIGVDVGAPLIWLEDVIEDQNGQPRALSQLRLRGDRIAFSATARRTT